MNHAVAAKSASAASTDGLTVRVLRSVPELEEIRHAWDSWPGHRDSNMDFYLTVLRWCPEAVRPHVLVVYRCGHPDAILVGRLDRRKVDFRLGYFHVAPSADILYFVNGALRGNPSQENIELLVNDVCHSLNRGEADAAYLNFLRADSYLYKLARTTARFLSRDYACTSQPHFCTSIRGNVTRFHRAMSRARHGAKDRHRKLLKAYPGVLQIRSFRQAADIDTLVHDVEQIARVSYQRGLGVGFMDSSETRERLRLAAYKTWLRGYVLYISERPCAYWVGNLIQGTLYGDYVGYDPEFAKYSPGMFIMTEVMEGFDSGDGEGVAQVDFGPGYARYKEVLSTSQWQESAVYIFAPSLKGFELNLIRSLTAGIHNTIKHSLGRTSLWKRIKKGWRRHATPHSSRTAES